MSPVGDAGPTSAGAPKCPAPSLRRSTGTSSVWSTNDGDAVSRSRSSSPSTSASTGLAPSGGATVVTSAVRAPVPSLVSTP
jgi:hypothetical protein